MWKKGPQLVHDNLLDSIDTDEDKTRKVRGERLTRGGSNSRRQGRPNLFYPVSVDPKKRMVAKVGEPVSLDTPKESVADIRGLATARKRRRSELADIPHLFQELLAAGYVRVGAHV